MFTSAVDEITEEFGASREEAETMAALEELGIVFDENGAITEVDPNAPIELVPNTEQTAAGWN